MSYGLKCDKCTKEESKEFQLAENVSLIGGYMVSLCIPHRNEWVEYLHLEHKDSWTNLAKSDHLLSCAASDGVPNLEEIDENKKLTTILYNIGKEWINS